MQATDDRQGSAYSIKSCEVCGSQALDLVLDLGEHPLCDDLLPIGSQMRCKEYPINIFYCDVCSTAHQRVQIERTILFPTNYHYRARSTADVLRGMEQLTISCHERFGDLKDKKVLDVGCNDGSLLNVFHSFGAVTIGVEPTGAAKDALAAGHNVFNAFWNPATAKQVYDKYGALDFITFTNVFAHISNLPELLEALKIVWSPRTILVIENHYLGSVLENYQFDTFYHEHPRTYSLTSFEWIARSLGAHVMDAEFPARYGGNIRVFISSTAHATMPRAKHDRREDYEAGFKGRFSRMSETIERWRVAKRRSIETLVAQHGKLSAKAFPGRAAILVKVLGLDETLIDAVYERPGSMKVGHYVPGTRIPILSEELLFEKGDLDRPILNFAWHISKEIRHYMIGHGYRGEIVDIFSPDEGTW